MHRITDFHLHTPGDPLDRAWQAFDEDFVQAERLWSAWGRAGKAAIVINYPGAWPPSVENGLQIAGHGLDWNEWRTRADLGYSSGAEYLVTLAGCDLITTADDPVASQAEWQEAKGWDAQPPDAAELVCPVHFRRARVPVLENRVWHLLSYPQGIRVGFGRDRDTLLAELKPGEWSDVLHASFKTAEGAREVVFRLKLLHHDHGNKLLRLFITPLCESGSGVEPPEWSSRLVSLAGLPLPAGDVWEAYNLGWIDGDTLIDLEDMEHERFAAAIECATESIDWSLLMIHDHGPDWFGHVLLNSVDPSLEADPAKRAEAERVELRLYQSLDRLIGEVMRIAGPESVIVVVSDHGQIPSGPWFNPRVVLEEAGLLHYEEGDSTASVADGVLVGSTVSFEPREIAWGRSRALPQRSVYVYVNLRGRDPHGIVEPGGEYDEVCDAIVRSLLDYVDPATGLHPVSLALRRRDAQVLGLPDDDDIGDVVYALNPPYGVGHAQQLPSVEYGVGSLNALFVISGPGIREGTELDRVVRLQDIAPTLSYLLALPTPSDADGAVLYQALADPAGPISELASLREELEGLRRTNETLEKVRNAYEKSVAITHSYNG